MTQKERMKTSLGASPVYLTGPISEEKGTHLDFTSKELMEFPLRSLLKQTSERNRVGKRTNKQAVKKPSEQALAKTQQHI